MVNLLFVGIGSAFGGIVRYWIGLHVKSGGSFPIATCIVNLVGSLLIGLLSGWLERSYSQSSLAPMIRSFAVIGFCGGFTTFPPFPTKSSGCCIIRNTVRPFSICRFRFWQGSVPSLPDTPSQNRLVDASHECEPAGA